MSDYTPPTEAVEAAAIEICGHGKDAFYEYPYNESAREDFRAKARAALTAAAQIIAAEAWDEGAQSGLDTGLTIAENVHANGGILDLASVPGPPINPYRKKETTDE